MLIIIYNIDNFIMCCERILQADREIIIMHHKSVPVLPMSTQYHVGEAPSSLVRDTIGQNGSGFIEKVTIFAKILANMLTF